VTPPTWAASLSNTPCTRYSRLSNRLYNRLYRVNKHPTGCQSGYQTGLTTVLNEQPLFIQPVVKPSLTTVLVDVRSTGCQTGLYNRFNNRLYTRYSRLSNRLSNGFDINRLNVCIHDTTSCQAGLTTGYMYRVNGASANK